MSKTRTFIAIEATDEVESLALATIEQLRTYSSSMKWVAPGNLHWTLQFLGDVNDVQIYEICRSVAQVAAQFSCFSLTSDYVGAFPSTTKPRAVWLGAGEGSKKLCQLQAHIEESLSNLGFRPEGKRFVPHLTLGRVGRQKHAGQAFVQQLTNMNEPDAGSMTVEEVIVFGSELEHGGPIYHVLGRAPLQD
ncbi:MAG: RNA 2',3'-cyclic phosphodiesterase [Pirellulales bacterium]|nr:RNA 2',3'-cyclic phosphodiesterase [Pirellulales bacterium]